MSVGREQNADPLPAEGRVKRDEHGGHHGALAAEGAEATVGVAPGGGRGAEGQMVTGPQCLAVVTQFGDGGGPFAERACSKSSLLLR